MQAVQHNQLSSFASRQLGITMGGLEKSSEKLSSGYRINRAADDAAGLSISEKMRWQIRGLNRASNNAQDGISLIQTAEGALSEVHSILDRLKELSVQAANDTNTETDRSAIQSEIDEHIKEINHISKTTQYNTMTLFDGSFSSVSSDRNAYDVYQFGNKTIILSFVANDGSVPTVASTAGVGANSFNSGEAALADFVKKTAGWAVNAFFTANQVHGTSGSPWVKVGLELGNIDGPSNTLAYAELGMSYTNSQTMMQYSIKVDISDYNPANFNSMTASQKADLGATIMHEMTHVIMYDTLTNGMLSGGYPGWFIEGTAQAWAGDSGWVSNFLSPGASDSAIKSYMNNSSVRDYGAGYLAAMYLGYLANDHPGSTFIMGITTGLSNLLNEMGGGKTLNEAIAALTPYSGVSDFEDHVFHDTDANTISFVKDLLNARGTQGQGALAGGALSANGLSLTKEAIFANAVGANPNYEIITSDKKVQNFFNAGFDPTYGGLGVDTSGTVPSRGGLHLQVGESEGDSMKVFIEAMNAATLGIGSLDVMNYKNASDAIDKVDKAINKVSSQRSSLGAYQNRLEHTISNLNNTSENVQASESRIRDTDMAKEMVRFSIGKILEQTGMSMLSQANQSPNGILQLLA